MRSLGEMTGRDYVRELVRMRDSHTCQLCGKKWDGVTRRFDVHHIHDCGFKSKAYDRKQDMDGMTTLCHKCHLSLPHVKQKIKEASGMFKKSKEKNQHPFYR